MNFKKEDFLNNLGSEKDNITFLAGAGISMESPTNFPSALNIAEILLEHKHDLIHKSVGWMLREAGNRDFDKKFIFLKEFYKKIPRTMLKYTIENLNLI